MNSTTFLEEYGSVDGSEDPDEERSLMMVRLCQRLITKCPAFIDGYAHLAGALFYLERFKEAVDVAEPVFSGLTSLLPTGSKGRVRLREPNLPQTRASPGRGLLRAGDRGVESPGGRRLQADAQVVAQ